MRKTISIPEYIYKKARQAAVVRDQSFSAYIVDSLRQENVPVYSSRDAKNPLETLGRLDLGIKRVYKKRSDLYEKHTQRKMGA